MSIETWAPTLKTNLAAVSGIRQVHKYDELPGSIMAFPTIIFLPVQGDQIVSAGGLNIAHHQVQVSLYVAPQVLPDAYALAVPFITLIRAAIAADVQLGGTCVHCLPVSPPEPFYTGPGALRYGDKEHIGIIFRLDVKEIENVTVAA